MAYKLKPNYHFANTSELGIDKVPVGRFIIIEDYGPLNEIKWFKKTSNTLIDDYDNVYGYLDSTSTINDALTGNSIHSPLDLKRDILDSYSQTEVDSMLSVKANSADVYTSTETEALLSNKANSADVYTQTEINSIIDDAIKNDSGIYQHSNILSASVTIEDNHNAMSVGPLTLSDNIVITIQNNSVWEII